MIFFKKEFVFLIGVISLASCMTTPIPLPEPIEQIFEVLDVSGEYSRARVWFGDSFTSAKDAITFEDVNAREIRGRSYSEVKKARPP